MIPIYTPYIGKYKQSACNAIDSEWISNYGIYVKNAEEKLKELLDVKYCILMNNGTAATHCLFISLKYMYPSIKKIYIPNNVFIAPWNCVLMEYSKEDLEVMKIDPTTFNIDTSEEYIKSLDKNSCVLIVHNLGNIVNVPKLKELRPDLIFVEDNCEGFYGKYGDEYSGCSEASLCSAVSFYANKTLTTGEGGAFFTNNLKVYKYIKRVYSHGMTDERYIHDCIAYNYRMTNIQAGFLYDQLSDIEHILSKKKSVFDNYDNLFEELIKKKQIQKIVSEKNTQMANWMYCIVVTNNDFQKMEKFMNEKKIQIRPFFYDIRRHYHLKNIKIEYDEIEEANYGVMLPSYPDLTLDQQKYIVNCLQEYLST